MLPASLIWWRTFVETDDAQKRRALLESAIKRRFSSIADGASKRDQKIARDAWEASWTIAQIGDPLEAIAQVESAAIAIAREAEVEIGPQEADLAAFLASPEAIAARDRWKKRAAGDSLIRWLLSEESQATIAETELTIIWCAEEQPQDAARLVFAIQAESDEQTKLLSTTAALADLDLEVRAKKVILSASDKRLLDYALAQGSTEVCRATEWMALFAKERPIRWSDGAELKLDLHPARLTLISEPSPMWAIALGDQTTRPLSGAEILREAEGPSGEPQLWVKDESALYPLDVLGMPRELFAHLLRSPDLPLDRLRGSVAGAMLARKLTASAPADLVKTARVKPIVRIHLEDETRYTVSVGAIAEDGTELVRSHGGAWVAKGKSSRGSAIAVLPRSEDVARLDAWLARLIPQDADRAVHADDRPAFSWRADGAATLQLVRRWLSRPSHVDYACDEAFENLVRIREAPQVRVQSRETNEGGIDWLEVSVELEDELSSLSLSDIADALERSEDDVLMVGGARLYRREHLVRYLDEVDRLLDRGIAPGAGWQRVRRRSSKRAESDERSPGETPARGLIVQIDPHARSFLRPYQLAGAEFLVRAAAEYGGALLADDMGLGKTLQTLSALTALRKLAGKEWMPSLVICPASVAHNWQREAKKFAPDLRTVVLEGGEKRRQIIDRLIRRDAPWDLVIENPSLVRRDVDLLERVELLMIAVDEAQSIKNPAAEITQSIKRLRARYRIALTGTPIENRLTDLWSIVDFTSRGYLGNRAAFEEMAKSQDAPVLHRMLRARMKPMLIRRLKKEVAPELPDRIEERFDCEMTEEQRVVYLAEVKRTRLLLEGVTRLEDMNGQNRVRVLAALTRLRQICCEPSLVDLDGRGSGKVDELMQLLPELLEAGHKVLVFSQFVRMLEILEDRMREQRLPFRVLTGQTQDRMEVVDAFENDPSPSVFLISLKAGGTGLNLTSASHVVLFDPWWSPALEAQAIDRSHRIGQDKTVVAIRLVAKGTIEERILELQDKKRHLSRDILDPDSAPSLTPEDLGFLLQDEA
jgi:superfamily II DNA or RNA helicase